MSSRSASPRRCATSWSILGSTHPVPPVPPRPFVAVQLYGRMSGVEGGQEGCYSVCALQALAMLASASVEVQHVLVRVLTQCMRAAQTEVAHSGPRARAPLR